MTIYFIRIKQDVDHPAWSAGAYIYVYDSSYAGLRFREAASIQDAEIFESYEEAAAAQLACSDRNQADYFEIVPFAEQPASN